MKARRSIRLKGYDYSQNGAYFVTICTQGRQCLFGNIMDEKMVLNNAGEIVKSVVNDLPNHYTHVELAQYVIMPNHFHGIVVLTDNVRAGLKPAPTKRHGLPEIVRGLKTFSSRRINQLRHTPGAKLWQRNYYEHIIRNDNDLQQIKQYIIINPAQWHSDHDNPTLPHTNHRRGGFQTRPWIETRPCGIEPHPGGIETRPYAKSPKPWKA